MELYQGHTFGSFKEIQFRIYLLLGSAKNITQHFLYTNNHVIGGKQNWYQRQSSVKRAVSIVVGNNQGSYFPLYSSPVSAGCDGILRQRGEARCSAAPPSSLPSWSLSGEGGHPQLLPGGGDQQLLSGGQQRGGPGMETQGCLCVYGQREPESLHWPGSSHVYYGGEGLSVTFIFSVCPAVSIQSWIGFNY